jgi:hypothetical protein
MTWLRTIQLELTGMKMGVGNQKNKNRKFNQMKALEKQ